MTRGIQILSRMFLEVKQQHTYSTAIGAASDDVVLQLEVLVEYGGIELDLPVELVPNLLPVRRWVCHFGSTLCHLIPISRSDVFCL
jgi:hypothetical protein